MVSPHDGPTIPVFIRRNVGVQFNNMISEEIAKIVQDLEERLGLFKKGGVTIASGGDFFIRPYTVFQQQQLLEQKLVKGIIEVTCTL